jgi:hypothetical protein
MPPERFRKQLVKLSPQTQKTEMARQSTIDEILGGVVSVDSKFLPLSGVPKRQKNCTHKTPSQAFAGADVRAISDIDLVGPSLQHIPPPREGDLCERGGGGAYSR